MTTTKRQKALILFDLDGVILDSRANMQHAWEAVRSELAVAVPFEAYFAEIGRPFADIMARLGLAGRANEIESVYRRASSRSLFDTPIYDGVETLLGSIADSGSKLGIVTSKDMTRTQLVLDRLPFRFAVVMTPREGLRGKPAPDALLSAMAVCNVDPADTIFIGDMSSDAEAAARARIDYAHAEWGYGDPPDHPTFSASLPAELQTFLLG